MTALQRQFSDDQLRPLRERTAEIVASTIALRRAGGGALVGLCAFHHEKTPSFYVWPDHYHCFGCGAHGDAISFVMLARNLSFVDAVSQLLDLPQQTARGAAADQPRQAEPRDDRPISERLHALLTGAGPITERTAAAMYLHMRGLPLNQPALLAHPSLLWAEEVDGPGPEARPWRRWRPRVDGPWLRGRHFPALVAPITSSKGAVTAAQRIWLVDRVESVAGIGPADNRAPISIRKKTLGTIGDGAVRLAPAGRTLGIGEGVETAIAASVLYRVPAWATCGVHRLGFPAHWRERVTAAGQTAEIWIPPERPPAGVEAVWIAERAPSVWIPDIVERLLIFGDRGPIGEVIALHAADWWRRQGRQATAVFPAEWFDDFNSELLGKVAT